jgi:3,4-dihydroxy 2-butanone 4-phosphate synthase/GTP cyclohydrolase II
MVTIAEIAAYRQRHEILVEDVSSANLPSAYGAEPLKIHAFRSLIDGAEHLALVKGPIANPALVRIHSECLTGDALGSLRCDCGQQLRAAIQQISESQSGVLVYMRGHEGRGVGLVNKIKAYALQDGGMDTVEANAALGFAADLRDYGIAAQILRALGVDELRLLTNNPEKTEALRAFGFAKVEQVPLRIESNPHNEDYLATKRDKMGHRLGGPKLTAA